MATLTKSTGTVTLSGAVEKVTFPAVYGWVWVKNMSDADMFVGLSDGISAGADGVMRIPAGECGRVQTDGQDSVYLMGTGNALVVAQNYADSPFKVGGKGGEVPDLSAYAKKTDVPNIKVNEAVNADTVNGHSVNADVPENAKFTDTIPDLSPYAKKTDIPTELPANGGDADTVDGKHASDFKAYQRYAPIYIGDLLDMTEMGTYSCSVPEVMNLPSGIVQWCYVTMIQFRDAGYRRYICVPLNNAVTDANELYLASEYARDSEGKLIWRNISDGGKAYTISEWGTRVISDLNNAELGFTAAAGSAGHLNAPNPFWSTVLTMGSNINEAYRTQIAFPLSGDSQNQVLKYRVMDNNTWYDWKEIYTSGNKPYVTGSATVAANSQICVTNHGFTPSAVIWWESSGSNGVAVSFDDSQFIINVISTGERTINYLMFK